MVKNAKVVYAVSEETVNFSKEKGKIPTVAENGVDDELFNPNRIDRREMKRALGVEFPLVIFVGKITPMYAKYLAAAIVAMRDVNERIPEAEFWIFGDGPCRAQLEDLASNSTGKVRFRGYIEHGRVPEVVAAADVGINAYRTGSIKMKEWAAMGLPIVGPQEMKEDFVRRCEWVSDKIAKEIVEILKNPRRDVVKVNTWSDTAKIMAETLVDAGLLRIRARPLGAQPAVPVSRF